MKQIKNVVLLVCVLIIAFSCNKQKKAEDLLAQKFVPYDYMSLIRSYPDNYFDYRNYTELVKKENIRLKTAAKSNVDWRLEGPGNIGGRINVVEADPNNANIILVGNASGGIYKTTNGGNSWYPVFDENPYLAIGAIAFDPNNSNIIYAGTGDPYISSFPFVGDGIYKSTDAGETWTQMGLAEASIISRIEVDPLNNNIIYAATMGLPFARTPDRGLYKSTDGGITWTHILFISNDSGIADMLINPTNPQILYATGWNRIRNRQESLIIGQAAKIYKTTDGGVTWNILTNGLPAEDMCRIGLCMSESNPNLIYAMYIGTDFEVYNIYKTINGGDSWTSLNISELSGMMGAFGWYFGQIRINPTNNNELYVLGVEMFKTTDGGTSWQLAAPEWWTYEVHADKHDLFFVNSTTLLLSTDGGLYKSTNDCVNWTDIDNIPNNQVYHVAINPFQSGVYRIGVQDNGTSDGNYNDINNWLRVFGGDGFQPLFDPYDSNIQYVETQNGNLYVSTDGGNYFNNFVSTIESTDRRAWDMPVIISPTESNTLFTGTYRIYKNSSSPSDNWVAISPDLTKEIDDRFHVISTISQSPINQDIIYSGASDGLVYKTIDGGSNWINISAGLPERYISSVKASPTDENTVYISNSGYMYNEYIPHIHKSINKGDTWTDISGDLPQFGINDIWILPSDENIIFTATDAGVYYTSNGGINWFRVGSNMPIVPVLDIEFDEANQRIVAGTYGKSLMSIDYQALFTNATIFPSQALYDIATQNNVTTNITWNSATSITSIKNGISNLQNTDYNLTTNVLTISNTYLSTVLLNNNQSITLTINFDSGNAANFVITAKNSSVNISDLTNKVNCYPNPSSGILTFDVSEDCVVDIFNILGKKIMTKKINQTENQIDLSTQIAGNYIVKVKGSKNYSFLIVIQK